MTRRNKTARPAATPVTGRAPARTASNLDQARPFRWSDGQDRLHLGIVLGVALALRLAYFFLNQAFNPTFRFPIMDSLYHHEWALDLVGGGTAGTDAFFRGPLYPYFLALLYKMSGNSIAFAILVQHLLGTLTAGLVYLTARLLFSRTVALVAGLTTALYWVLVYMEGDLLVETTFIFFNSLSLLLLTMGMSRHRIGLLAAGGFALGLATITRPSVLVFVPVIPLAIYLTARKRPPETRGWISRSIVTLAACAIPIMPVMIRNYRVAGAIVPVGTSGGVNFFIGNNPLSDGSTAIVPGTRADWWGGYNDAIAIAERDRGHKLTLAEVSDYYFDRGFEFMRARPEQARALMLKKLRMFWGAGERANDKFIYFFWHLVGMKYVLLPGFWLVAPLGMLGGVLLWRRRSELAMFYLFIALYSIGVVAFFVNARFRLPIIPVLTLFSAYASVYLVSAFREKRFAVLKALLVLTVAAAFVNSDYIYQKQMRAYSDAFSNYTLANAYLKMGLKSTALTHYARADEINRESPTDAYHLISRDVDYNLGVLLAEQGLCSRAIEVLERVGGNDQFAADALDRLGDCYLKRRDVESARRVFESLRQVSPADERGIVGLARCAAMTGDFAQAEKMLNEIVDPSKAVYAPAYVVLAEVQRAQGRIDDAIKSYTHIAQLTGYERQGYMALAELYHQKGDNNAALKAVEQAQIYSPPDDAAIRGLLATIRARP